VPAGTRTPGVQTAGRSRRSPGRSRRSPGRNRRRRRRFDTEGS